MHRKFIEFTKYTNMLNCNSTLKLIVHAGICAGMQTDCILREIHVTSAI